jgi:hypothetical protein
MAELATLPVATEACSSSPDGWLPIVQWLACRKWLVCNELRRRRRRE